MVGAAALAVRVLAVLADSDYEPRHDAFDYDRHGDSIADGDGFPESGYVIDGGPSALRAPMYPYLLGAVYRLTGDGATAGRLAGAVLGALAVVLVYLVVEAVWGRRTALVAGTIAAFFPPLVLMTQELFSEALFLVFELAAVLAVLAFRRSGAALRWAVLAGVLCGLAALTRAPGLVLVLPIALGTWPPKARFGAAAAAGPALVVVCAALTIAPWTLRNEVEFGRFIPLTTSTGIALSGTYNEVSMREEEYPAPWERTGLVPEFSALLRTPGIDEGTLDATLRDDATRFAWEHPLYVAEAAGWNLLRLFHLAGGAVVERGVPVNDHGIGTRSVLIERLAVWLLAPLTLLGAVALVLARRPRRDGRDPDVASPGPLFLWLVPIALIAVTVPIAGVPRYRAPIDPFLIMLAAIGLVWAWARLGRPRSKPGATIRAGLALLGAVAVIGASGCGDGNGDSTVPEAGTTAVSPEAPSKRRYIARADAICDDALGETRRLARRYLQLRVKGAGASDPLVATTEGLIRPGLRIRERQADRLRRLELPAEDRELLDQYLGLFDPLLELIRQRLEAGRAGERAEAARLEGLATEIAEEQSLAARSFGFRRCDDDFLLEAFPTEPGP